MKQEFLADMRLRCRQIRVPGFLTDDVIKAAKKRRVDAPGSEASVAAAVRAANAAKAEPEKKP